MKVIFKILFFLLPILFSNSLIAQTTVPYYNLQGKWINSNNGIKVEFDRFIILERNGEWKTSSKLSDIYNFIFEPIINEPTVYETWVENIVITEITLSDNKKHKVNTKQYRLIKLEINKKGKLDLYISNTIKNYENEPNKYWIEKLDDIEFPTKLSFKKYVEK